MIRVRIGRLADVDAEAVVRPVRSDLEALTSESRELIGSAGPAVAARLRDMGETPPGAALITPAGDLDTGFLIHVVLQSPDQPVTAAVLGQGLTNALRRAEEWAISSVAIPPLGTGAGQVEAERAAEIMIPLLADQLRTGALERIEIVVPSVYELEVFRAAVPGD